MDTRIADLRKEYTQSELDESSVLSQPIEQFERWFQEALSAELPEPNAMHLSTADAEGRPSGRMVLIKGIEAGGILFFTNYESRKGQQLAANPYAALTFFWPELERQVRIEGRVEKTSAERSEAYFRTRPKGSRIGAWSSPQSKVIAGRRELEQHLNQYHDQFADKDDIPLPSFWGGYLLQPSRFEFWQGRPNRLHDRIEYLEQPNGAWQIQRLAP